MFEKDYTATYREGSLSVKSIIAQMINSIVIPVVTAYKIKEDVYSTSGLVNNIFLLGITTTIIPPLVLAIDPYNLFMKVMRCIKSRPCNFALIQPASSTRIRRNTTISTKASNLKSDSITYI